MNISMCDGRVSINGQTYVGDNISIIGDRVVVDGKDKKPTLAGPIDVTVEGDCNLVELQCGTVSISGNVSGVVQTGSGDIHCGTVGGNVQNVSGDINCGNVTGSVRTGSGDICHR